jgi:hypothetical protein
MLVMNRATSSLKTPKPINANAPKPKPAPIAAIFTLPEVGDAEIVKAKREIERTTAAATDADAALRNAVKKYPPRHGFAELVEHPNVTAARQALAHAEHARQAAQAAMSAAIFRREREFEVAVIQRFERAAPHLAAAAEALADVVAPMTEMHNLAWRYRFPVGRLLGEVPRLQEALRVMTMLGNVGMAPAARVKTDDE